MNRSQYIQFERTSNSGNAGVSTCPLHSIEYRCTFYFMLHSKICIRSYYSDKYYKIIQLYWPFYYNTAFSWIFDAIFRIIFEQGFPQSSLSMNTDITFDAHKTATKPLHSECTSFSIFPQNDAFASTSLSSSSHSTCTQHPLHIFFQRVAKCSSYSSIAFHAFIPLASFVASVAIASLLHQGSSAVSVVQHQSLECVVSEYVFMRRTSGIVHNAIERQAAVCLSAICEVRAAGRLDELPVQSIVSAADITTDRIPSYHIQLRVNYE